MASELEVAAVAEMVSGAWQLVNLKDHVAGGAEVVEGTRPLVVPEPVVVMGFAGANQQLIHRTAVDQCAVGLMTKEVAGVVVVEGEVLKQEELIEVDEGREQLPLALELETVPLANALLEFAGEAVAIPQLAVDAALTR